LNPLTRAHLIFDTVRYLSPIQIFGRIWFHTYRPNPDTSLAPGLRQPLNNWISGPSHERITGDCCHFRFLNVEGKLSGPEGWNDPEREKLWLYNLHYFDYLRPGAMEGTPGQVQSSMIGRWIYENPPAVGNGWEPYPLSLRTVNWIKWHLAGNALEEGAVHSLAVQTRYLAKRLEWHLLGNHLFANAKALVFAGMFFEGDEADSWLGKGLRILAKQVPEQVLPDGGHFELSPMYHCIILEDLLDLVNLVGVYGVAGEDQRSPDTAVSESGRALGHARGLNPGFRASSRLRPSGSFHSNPFSGGKGGRENPEGFGSVVSAWIDAAQSMRGWLRVMCHPDGGIAFFNDAAFGIAPDREALERYAGRLGLSAVAESAGDVSALRESGYIRLSRGPMLALLDVGRIGPDYIPGHAHADSLGFELSLGSQRVIVNSGISCYGVREERHRQRSTASHNTVVIDGENSSEVWGGFRVARRATPFGLEIEEHSGTVRVSCAHDGYRRLSGRPVHRRRWTLREGELRVRDSLEGGFCTATGRLYFHPDVKPSIAEDGRAGAIALPDGATLDFELHNAAGRIVQSTWHPEFGKALPNLCLEYEFNQPEVDLILHRK